jgi:hypothetical protein
MIYIHSRTELEDFVSFNSSFQSFHVLNKIVKNDLYSFKERIGGFCSFSSVDFMFPIIPCSKYNSI